MSRFRKKPIVIDAVRWNGATIGLTDGGEPYDPMVGRTEKTERLHCPDWLPPVERVVTDEKACGNPAAGAVWRDGDDLWIGTLEGPMLASPGDWIIRGIKGELYPCKPDIFAATYEPADTSDRTTGPGMNP